MAISEGGTTENFPFLAYIYLYHRPYPYKGFAGRPLELKCLTILPIFLGFSRFPRHFKVSGVGRSIAKTIVTVAT